MKVLFLASEALPFIKTGGLGDVAQSLPYFLSKKSDCDVRVMIPYYKKIKENKNFKVKFLCSFDMPLAWRTTYVGIYEASYKGVTYYFIDNEYYFKRDGSYGFYDDGERFAYFAKAALESLMCIGFYPDIIHANDWQTGLVPLFLNAFYKRIPEYSNIKTLFTIHNIEYQGKTAPEFLEDVIGLGEDYRYAVEDNGCVNFMKSAIIMCDALSTVSETYSYEIRYSYFGHGLSDVINDNAYKLSGIVNGIDTEINNPKTDKNIPFNYDANSSYIKAKNKAFLQESAGLLKNPDVPVISLVSRLVSHKGLDLIKRVSNELANLDMQFIILGTGDSEYEDMLKDLSYRYKDKVSAEIRFDSSYASLIYAGSDFVLMPSKSEPCGLTQLIALRYGAIPIVRETGGLVDTVKPVNISEYTGSGFTFKAYNAHDMLDAVKRAVDFYNNKEGFEVVRKNIMEEDVSFKKSADKYYDLYKRVKGE